MVTSYRLIGESSSSLRITSGEAILLAIISSRWARNLRYMQTGMSSDPKIPNRMKKLSMPSLPRLICAITGSLLQSANFFLRRSSLFSIISRCFSPGVFSPCCSMSSVTPIFRFIRRILLVLLSSIGGSTSLSTNSFTSEILMPRMRESQLSRMRRPSYYLIMRSCSTGEREEKGFLGGCYGTGAWSFFIWFIGQMIIIVIRIGAILIDYSSCGPTRSLVYYTLHPIIPSITSPILQQMLNWLRALSAHIYDIFISFFFTVASHLLLIDHLHLSGGNFLDVGCGTGKPLATIVNRLKRVHQKIIGVDLHPAYTEKAIRLFQGDKQVEIYNLDFYKISEYLQLKFRTVFFSFSFMLMPDQLKALQVAKTLLEKTPQSRISFALTINKSRNSLLAKIKPLIKRLTTVDFGNVVYEDSFLQLLDSADLEVLKFVRLRSSWNVFLWLSPVYFVECRLKVAQKQ